MQAHNIIKNFLKSSFPEFCFEDIKISPLIGGKSSATLFKLEVVSTTYVLRLPPLTAKPLNKLSQVLLAKQAWEQGVGPKIHFIDPEHYAIIMDYIPSRTASPVDFENPELLNNFATLLQTLHASKLEFPVAVSPFKRFHDFLLKCEQSKINYPEKLAKVKPIMEEIEEILRVCPIGLTPCHLDLNLSNILIAGDQFTLVDWVNGGMSDPYFDLATFAVFADLNETQTKEFLFHYFQHEPTEFEWTRFLLIRPVRLFVIAASCFSAASDEEISKMDNTKLDSMGLLTFDEFIHKNENRLNYSHAEIGYATLEKGLEFIRDHSFRDAIDFISKSIR